MKRKVINRIVIVVLVSMNVLTPFWYTDEILGDDFLIELHDENVDEWASQDPLTEDTEWQTDTQDDLNDDSQDYLIDIYQFLGTFACREL